MSKPFFIPAAIYSRAYSVWSKYLHKRGYHYTGQLSGPDGDMYWCHWCGLRGTVMTPHKMERAQAELTTSAP